jgi:hypothetical protein
VTEGQSKEEDITHFIHHSIRRALFSDCNADMEKAFLPARF